MRYERKYRIEGLPPAWVRQVLIGHPSGFRTLHPDRQVNNIYFDTADLSAFSENTAGVPARRKHRLRWYGSELGKLKRPTFEIKIKDRELGRKESQRFAALGWSELSALFQQIPALQEQPLLPVLVNGYQRSYLRSRDGRFRVTLDWDLKFAPFSWDHPPSAMHYLPDSAVIMELKYKMADDDRANEIFRHLPFRLTKNSKYVTGINLILG